MILWCSCPWQITMHARYRAVHNIGWSASYLGRTLEISPQQPLVLPNTSGAPPAYVTGNTINVANSFGIPFEEDERDAKTWFLDHNYIDGKYEMFKKVNGMFHHLWLILRILKVNFAFHSERANDWMVSYRTQVARIRPGDQWPVQEIHRKAGYGHCWRTVTGSGPTDAYFAVEEIKDVSHWFTPLQDMKTLILLGWHRNSQDIPPWQKKSGLNISCGT